MTTLVHIFYAVETSYLCMYLIHHSLRSFILDLRYHTISRGFRVYIVVLLAERCIHQLCFFASRAKRRDLRENEGRYEGSSF